MRIDPAASSVDNLARVSDSLSELSAGLRRTVDQMRAGQLNADGALQAIEECSRMASEVSAQVDQRSRAALEPLPDLPGQLPLPSA
jgi:ABC-type transporter Mla subunit MlaD